MALYATPGDLASYLQQDLDTSSATLVLTLASGLFAAAADTQFSSTAVTYTRIGTPSVSIVLPFRPVIAVQAVRINGVVITGYSLIKNVLYRLAGFGTPLNNPPDVVQVDLTYGYTSVPDDVRAAVLETAAAAYLEQVSAARSERIDDYAVTFTNGGGGIRLTNAAQLIAASYCGTWAA